MLPPFWQTATLFNPIVYLVSGFRWAFFDTADVAVSYSLAAILLFSVMCVGVISWIFKIGYRLKS
jgi:ABC-2 type transport system permease protein